MTRELYPHQRAAVDSLSNGKILGGQVGTGKSFVAATYYIEKESPKDVYVITTAKKRNSLDWEGEFVRLGVYKSADTTVAGILTVDSWNNIERYLDVRDAFFIFDEARNIGSGAWAKAFIKIAKANRWILLSATPADTWLEYATIFVANGFYKNRTEFKREHCIYSYYGKFPKLERYVGVGKLLKLRNSLLVEMPYLRHTTRVTREVRTSFDKQKMDEVQKKRWHVFEERPIVDAGELHRVARKISNSDASRFLTIRSLLTVHPKLIIFYNFNYELDILRELSEDTTVAEWNGQKHEPIPNTDSWAYLVQFSAGAEGWNCITADTIVMYSLTYSYKTWHQAFGRIDRLNTPFNTLYYYILISDSWIDKAIKRALDAKKSFNEARDGVKW